MTSDHAAPHAGSDGVPSTASYVTQVQAQHHEASQVLHRVQQQHVGLAGALKGGQQELEGMGLSVAQTRAQLAELQTACEQVGPLFDAIKQLLRLRGAVEVVGHFNHKYQHRACIRAWTQ